MAVIAGLAMLLVAGAWSGGGREQLASIRTRIAIGSLVTTAADLPVARFTLLRRSGVLRAGLDETLVRARSSNVLRVSSEASPVMRGSASAVAYGVARDWSAAVAVLEAAVAEEPNDASLWSDLAAARYERSVGRDVEGVLAALVAADRSRAIDPHNATALFNRALILEDLGLRNIAADAWRECLDVATDALLIADARARLEANETEKWPNARKDLERAVEAGDVATINAIVARFPQEARAHGEVTYLFGWAEAYLKRDTKSAAKSLAVARATGAALRARGETLLADAVAAIDGAAGNDAALRTLAAAQVAYDQGRDAFSVFSYFAAEKLFREAANGFARAGSPMEFVSRAYLAFALLDEGDAEGAHRLFTSLGALVRNEPGRRALLAMAQWGKGRCELFLSRWDDSATSFREARALYRNLGESANAGFMDTILAEIFDRVGRPDLAWPHCVAGWHLVGASSDAQRVQAAIAQGVRLAIRAREWDVAASLLELELDVAFKARSPAVTSVALRRMYTVQHERKDFESRDIALMRARIAAAHAGDEGPVQLAEIDQAEAIVMMESDPRRAAAILTRGIAFVAKTDRRIFLADLLWNRGRANAAAGDLDAAWADFAAGIDELERQRGAIAAADMRARFFDSGEGLFDDALRVLIRRGEIATAFEYADRARGRLLLDPDGVAGPPPANLLPALAERLRDTALLEYVVVDDELLIFCVRNGAVTMKRVPVTTEVLRAKIDRSSPDLYDLLITPVAEEIALAGSLIVVADDDLQRISFSGLQRASTRRFLVQSHVISMAPSAAVLTSRAPRAAPPRTALLIGNATTADDALPSLPNVEREIASLRSVYRSPRIMMGADATTERFVAEAPSYDAIHFAGHGSSNEESLTASLIFPTGRLYMSDIARLRLPHAPLVVLGACGTLRGRVSSMEGMPSLARSFLMAGASTVLGTLQDIDDATARHMMTAFHRSVAAGATPAEALRQAQLDAIARGGEAAEPKNWAPYVVYTATP